MENLFLSNILDAAIIVTCLCIVARACFVYPKVLSLRILVLGFSLGIILLTAAVDLVSTNMEEIATHTDWFLYVGSLTGFLCILLSLVNDSEEYLRRLLGGQVFATVLLLCILLFSFALPIFPGGILRGILGGTRFLVCISISFYYISGFMKRQTRFGLLMSSSFLLLAIGYLMDTQQYFVPLYAGFFDGTGDICRLFGFLALLGAVLIG